MRTTGTLLAAGAVLFTLLAASPSAPIPGLPPGTWKIIGWNDLGMHCMDSDYSVFSILPPFNDINAQIVDDSGDLLTSPGGVTLSYRAVADPQGSVNTTSAGKTNYWTFAPALYGASPVPDTGLAGNPMPGPANTPRPMAFDAGRALFKADGVPITPYDDAGHKRPYPMMELVARNSGGAVLATTRVVLPVSDEMDCSACHASGSGAAARPAAGWVHAANHDRDYRLNILRLHDEREGGTAGFTAALAAAGYLAAGLEATVAAGTPILCARCHASNALPGTGIAGVTPLTTAMHAGHASVTDPVNGLTLDASANRSACYRCHPGSETRCLRGAMGSAVAANGTMAMQCQSCHGGMSAVGAPGRVGWLDQPSCQNCHTGTATHNNGQIRYTTALLANGQRRQAVDATFATDPGVPAAGFDLYRFSAGHGGLACEACHGSTHAEYPSAHGNDNVQIETLQGHAGTLVECTACHQGMPETVSGGPHGMHPVGQQWMIDHHEVGSGGTGQCRTCHGADYRGTVLSVMQATRTFSTPWGQKTFFRGSRISCWGCHDGPTESDENPNHRPTAQNAAAVAGGAPVTVTLQASDADNDPLTFRIISQPAHGTVALAGAQATYFPEPGFAGADTFTFAAWDGDVDSDLGTVTVTRSAGSWSFGTGYPGTGNAIPVLALSGPPAQGTAPVIQLGNTAGTPTPAALVVSAETAARSTQHGGVLLVEPETIAFLDLPAAGLGMTWAVPVAPPLTGLVLHAQLLVADPGARFGLAFSRGLGAAIGP